MNVDEISEQNNLALEYLEIYAFADPAAGRDAKTRAKIGKARQAITVGARDWLDRWFFLLLWAGKLTATKFKEKILDVQEQYNPRIFGIEANGMQVLFGNLVREEAKMRFGKVKMISVYQPTNVDKNFRIRTGLEPVINQGRLFVMEEAVDARSELAGFPTAATKDIVDAMETTIRLAPARPIGKRNDAEFEQYAKYLRSSKMPASVMARKLEEFRVETGVSAEVANAVVPMTRRLRVGR